MFYCIQFNQRSGSAAHLRAPSGWASGRARSTYKLISIALRGWVAPELWFFGNLVVANESGPHPNPLPRGRGSQARLLKIRLSTGGRIPRKWPVVLFDARA